jgi:peroxiredoxin
LRDHELELKKRNIAVVVLTFENDFLARAYAEDTDLRWPLLIDETREVYRGYGMLSASFWDIWGAKTWWAYVKGIARGEKIKGSQGDIYQRGGDVLIDPAGMVRLHHIGVGPSDRPDVETILQIVRT